MTVVQSAVSPAEIKEALGQGDRHFSVRCEGAFGASNCFKWKIVEDRRVVSSVPWERQLFVLVFHQLLSGADDLIACLSPPHETAADWGMWRFEAAVRRERRRCRLECIVSRREMFDPAYRQVTSFGTSV